MQGALSSIIQPTRDTQSCGGGTALAGVGGKSPASPQQAELELCGQVLQPSWRSVDTLLNKIRGSQLIKFKADEAHL